MANDVDEANPYNVWQTALLKFSAPLKILITLTKEKKQLVMVDHGFDVEGTEIHERYDEAGRARFKGLEDQFGAVSAEWSGGGKDFGTYAEFIQYLRRLL